MHKISLKMYEVPLLEFLNIGGGEMMIIVIAILLLFGGKKLPELARGLGKGLREFKDASEGVKREIHRNINSFDVDEEDKKSDEKKQRFHASEDDSQPIKDETTLNNETDSNQSSTETEEANKETKSSA